MRVSGLPQQAATQPRECLGNEGLRLSVAVVVQHYSSAGSRYSELNLALSRTVTADHTACGLGRSK